MYIGNAIIEGLRILGLDKKTIKKASREKDLEEIFISTLFLNYFIVLVVYLLGLILGGYNLNGRELNTPVLFGLLMIYPFFFNIVIFGIYSLFGYVAELLNKKNHIHPLLSVGFHTAIVYALLLYIIGLIATLNASLALFLLGIFFLYFLYTMFVVISTVYDFSLHLTLIVLMTPFLTLGLVAVVALVLFPELIQGAIQALIL